MLQLLDPENFIFFSAGGQRKATEGHSIADGALDSQDDRLDAGPAACRVWHLRDRHSMQGNRRLKDKVDGIRAVWLEWDGPGALPPFPITPSMIVESFARLSPRLLVG